MLRGLKNMSQPNEELIRKHKPLTPAEIKTKMKEHEDAKKQFSTDNATLDAELEAFNQITDPLVNPVSGKAMCWIRRPTQAEWEEMVPKELAVYANNPEDIPEDLAKKYNDMTFELMAKIIVNPKHDASWWKQHSNLVMIQLFQAHLSGVFKELGLLTTNF